MTINGYDFPASVPEVTLGMKELAVVSVTESAMLTGLPELQSGTYLLAATWTEGGRRYFLPDRGRRRPGGAARDAGTAGLFRPVPVVRARVPLPAGTTNTHLGARALESVTTGTGNTAVGLEALRSLSTGRDNAAFGRLVLRALTTGRANLSIGTSSMLRATDASFNTAIGSDTLKATLSGQDNVAIGTGALLFSLGNQDVGIGRSALRRNTEGSGNIAIGYGAGRNSLTGSNNVYIGNAGARDEEGTIRIGTEGVHNRIYLAGEVQPSRHRVPPVPRADPTPDAARPGAAPDRRQQQHPHDRSDSRLPGRPSPLSPALHAD